MGTNTADEDLTQDPTTSRFLNAAILGTSQPDTVNGDMGTEGLMETHTVIICTFTNAPGDSDTSASPLTPFYQPDRETPWPSDAAPYTGTFGYSYALVPDAIIANVTELSANAIATVNVLYSPEGVFSRSKRKIDENRGWPVAIQALSTALDAVTAADTSNIDDVVDYLKANLLWTVNKTDEIVLPTEQISSLLLIVQDEIVTHPASGTEPPVYGTETLHPKIRIGKAGGASP